MATTVTTGSKLPSAGLLSTKGEPFAFPTAGKIAIFAVPGAFTPGCSATHLPGFIKDADALRTAGIKEVFCVSVNDHFVMKSWGEAHKADGKVTMVADPNAEFTNAMGLAVDLKALGGTRSKRYSAMYVSSASSHHPFSHRLTHSLLFFGSVEDGTITKLNVEPGNGTGLTCSLSNELLK